MNSVELRSHAERLLTKTQFSREDTARAEGLLKAAELAAAAEGRSHSNGGDGQPKAVIEIPDGFKRWLRTGVGWPEKRDSIGSDSGSGAYPGGTAPFTPVGFEALVWESMRGIDDIWNSDVTTIRFTDQAGPTSFPLSDDTQNSAEIIGQGDGSDQQDVPISAVAFNTCPTWRSKACLVSNETLQDSGIDIARFLAQTFATRFARGISPTIIAKVLVAAYVAVTAAGAGSAGQTMLGQTSAQTSLSSDDLAAVLSSCDSAILDAGSWLMSASTLAAIFSLRSSTTNTLIFKAYRDPTSGCFQLFGKDVRLCPSVASIAASNVPVLFGDMRRIGIRLVRNGTYAIRSDQRYGEFYQTFFESFTRSDSAVLWYSSNPSTPNPFIAVRCHS